MKPFKGEGKGGNLGLPIGSNIVADAGKDVIPPAPVAKTREAVHELFDNGNFKIPPTPFWDGKEIWKVVKGTHCLWKGVGTGKNGGESTKVEVFHGECHGWEKDMVILS